MNNQYYELTRQMNNVALDHNKTDQQSYDQTQIIYQRSQALRTEQNFMAAPNVVDIQNGNKLPARSYNNYAAMMPGSTDGNFGHSQPTQPQVQGQPPYATENQFGRPDLQSSTNFVRQESDSRSNFYGKKLIEKDNFASQESVPFGTSENFENRQLYTHQHSVDTNQPRSQLQLHAAQNSYTQQTIPHPSNYPMQEMPQQTIQDAYRHPYQDTSQSQIGNRNMDGQLNTSQSMVHPAMMQYDASGVIRSSSNTAGNSQLDSRFVSSERSPLYRNADAFNQSDAYAGQVALPQSQVPPRNLSGDMQLENTTSVQQQVHHRHFEQVYQNQSHFEPTQRFRRGSDAQLPSQPSDMTHVRQLQDPNNPQKQIGQHVYEIQNSAGNVQQYSPASNAIDSARQNTTGIGDRFQNAEIRSNFVENTQGREKSYPQDISNQQNTQRRPEQNTMNNSNNLAQYDQQFSSPQMTHPHVDPTVNSNYNNHNFYLVESHRQQNRISNQQEYEKQLPGMNSQIAFSGNPPYAPQNAHYGHSQVIPLSSNMQSSSQIGPSYPSSSSSLQMQSPSSFHDNAVISHAQIPSPISTMQRQHVDPNQRARQDINPLHRYLQGPSLSYPGLAVSRQDDPRFNAIRQSSVDASNDTQQGASLPAMPVRPAEGIPNKQTNYTPLAPRQQQQISDSRYQGQQYPENERPSQSGYQPQFRPQANVDSYSQPNAQQQNQNQAQRFPMAYSSITNQVNAASPAITQDFSNPEMALRSRAQTLQQQLYQQQYPSITSNQNSVINSTVYTRQGSDTVNSANFNPMSTQSSSGYRDTYRGQGAFVPQKIANLTTDKSPPHSGKTSVYNRQQSIEQQQPNSPCDMSNSYGQPVSMNPDHSSLHSGRPIANPPGPLAVQSGQPIVNHPGLPAMQSAQPVAVNPGPQVGQPVVNHPARLAFQPGQPIVNHPGHSAMQSGQPVAINPGSSAREPVVSRPGYSAMQSGQPVAVNQGPPTGQPVVNYPARLAVQRGQPVVNHPGHSANAGPSAGQPVVNQSSRSAVQPGQPIVIMPSYSGSAVAPRVSQANFEPKLETILEHIGLKQGPAFAKLKRVVEEILNTQDNVLNFRGRRGDREYIIIEEMLTKHLLVLDGIPADGNEEVRLSRRSIVRQVQGLLALLENRAKT